MGNYQPQGVEFLEKPEDLRPYIIDQKIAMIQGGLMLGRGNKAILLDPKFLEGRRIIDIWRESMIAGGIVDPFESEIINPIKFSL
jgi:hypothetical protein